MHISGVESALRQCPDVVRWFTSLKDVQLRTQSEPENGIFIAEGETVIRRAFAAGYALRAVMAEPRWNEQLGDLIAEADHVPVISASPEALTSITGYHVHRGALAAFARRPLTTAAELLTSADRVVFIEGMVNHTNVGSIFRSAAAMRMDAILVDAECADPLYRRAIRTSMGTVFQMPWARASLAEVVASSRRLKVALTPSAEAVDIRTIDWTQNQRLALMVGTEGAGLSRASLEAADLAVVIPMSAGIDSLNAAAATAVACYEINRGALCTE